MSRVLLIGGTGSIGRLVAGRLLDLGDTPRVLTRHPDRAQANLGGRRVEVAVGDLTDSGSLASAVNDADAVVMTHGAPYGSGDYEAVDYGAVPALLDALAGRQMRVVLMSSIGVTTTGGPSRELLNWKRRGERLLRASGLPYTIVRPGWFDAGTGTKQHIDLRQGDLTEYGPVRREQSPSLSSRHSAHRKRPPAPSRSSPPTDHRSATGTPPSPPRMPTSPTRSTAPTIGPPPDQEPERVRTDLRRHRSTP